MTQEEKELSFIDISGRLHYGVIVNYKENEYDHHKWKITSLHTLSYSQSGTLIDTDYDGWISYEEHQGCGMSTGSRPFRLGEVLPYLRPLSSMTEEERKEYNEYLFYGYSIGLMSNTETAYELIDWLNKKMFDYRGLILMNLALEAPEGMYKNRINYETDKKDKLL